MTNDELLAGLREVEGALEYCKLKTDLNTVRYGCHEALAILKCLQAEMEKQPEPISEDLLEWVINEHDMNVPDNLLASPGAYGAHRDAMRAALNKIIPMTMHIEAEYRRDKAQMEKRDAVDVGRVARAIWDWEHEGRSSQVLDIKWSLLKTDYAEKAKAAIAAMRR